MQVFKTTIPDLERQEFDVLNMVNLEVKIGDVVYTISEREGMLRVSIDGQILAMPSGANMLVLGPRR